MKTNKEKLQCTGIATKWRMLRRFRLKFNSERIRSRRTMAMVGNRLEGWVAEGNHRRQYASMDDILEDLGLTRSELSSYCSKKFGKNFLTWRKELRIAEAGKMLLDFPDKSAAEIGREVGIDDRSNFRHQFKSVTGCSPSSWREKFQKNANNVWR